jgi:two-component system response regulator
MNKNATIIICDDDEDDLFLLKSVLDDINVKNQTTFLKNGLELIEYLQQKSHIGLVLLDLNMPKMDGREALKIIKNNVELRHIPIVVLTTSNSPKDIEQCYALGANCFMTKPSSYEGLNDAVSTLTKYWLQLSHLPLHN